VPSVVHVVVTGEFAGVERYVSDAARETAARGWEPVVVGGSPQRMRAALGDAARWLPGATPVEALRSLRRLGRRDVCHAHMTIAETVAVAARPFHRAAVVSTRHFAAPRGASRAGHLLSPWIARGLARQIAVSDFVARRLEQPPDAVIRNGVPSSECLWRSSSNVVLVLQRLSPEKDTVTALRGWQASELAEEGWSLRIVGAGSERAALEAYTRSAEVPGVSITGPVDSVADEFATAAVLLAPAPADSFGLAVVEAMAAGVPVVACAAGGHLETVGLLPGAAMFPAGDAEAAASALRSLRSEAARSAASEAGRQLVDTTFTIARHVDSLLIEYEAARQPAPRSRECAHELDA